MNENDYKNVQAETPADPEANSEPTPAEPPARKKPGPKPGRKKNLDITTYPVMAARLRSCREESHETLDQIAHLVGVNKSTVQRWENGNTVKVNIPTLNLLAQHYGVDVAWLAGENVPQNRSGDWLRTHAVPVDQLGDASRAWSNANQPQSSPLWGNWGTPAFSPAQNNIVRQTSSFIDDIWGGATPMWDGIHFWLRVTDSSMAPLMCEGDLLLVRRQSSVDNGCFAVVLLDDGESLVRRVEYDREGMLLCSANPACPSRRISNEDSVRVTIIGQVLESKRKFA